MRLLNGLYVIAVVFNVRCVCRIESALLTSLFVETAQSASVQCITQEVYGRLWVESGGYASHNVTYNYGALLNQPVIRQLLSAGPTKGALPGEFRIGVCMFKVRSCRRKCNSNWI